MMRIITVIVFLLCAPTVSGATIIWETNFPGTWNSLDDGLSHAWPYTDSRNCTTACPPAGWNDYREGAAESLHPPTYNSLFDISGNTLTVTYETDSYEEGGSIGKWIGDPDGSSGGYEELYIAWDMKLAAYDQWNYNTGQCSWKLLRLVTDVALDGLHPPDQMTNGYLYLAFVGSSNVLWADGGALFVSSSTETSPEDIHASDTNVASSPYYHLFTGNGTVGGFNDVAYHRVKFHVVLNTPGTADGVLEVYIDGTRVLYKTNWYMRTTGSTRKIKWAMFMDNSSNTVYNVADPLYGENTREEQTVQVKNLVFSTSDILDSYVPEGGSDVTNPTVAITTPEAGTVSGTVTVSATCTDDTACVGVQFKHGSTNIGAEDTGSPYSVDWDTTQVANGSYTLTATGRDAAGNSAVSSGVAVTVANSAPATKAIGYRSTGAVIGYRADAPVIGAQ